MSNQQLINFSSEISNIPMKVEIIDLSDDQDIEKLKRPHIRKTVDPKWFDDYPWLEAELVNENTVLYCRICRNCNGTTVFARGTPLLRIEQIKDHMKTKEHKKSEESLKPGIPRQLSTEILAIISLMKNIYFCSKHNIPINDYPDLCNLMTLIAN